MSGTTVGHFKNPQQCNDPNIFIGSCLCILAAPTKSSELLIC